jgi:hypothetical protein
MPFWHWHAPAVPMDCQRDVKHTAQTLTLVNNRMILVPNLRDTSELGAPLPGAMDTRA